MSLFALSNDVDIILKCSLTSASEHIAGCPSTSSSQEHRK